MSEESLSDALQAVFEIPPADSEAAADGMAAAIFAEISGAAIPAEVFQAYINSGTAALTGSFSGVSWTEDIKDTGYGFSSPAQTITLPAAGRYHVLTALSINNTSANRTGSEVGIFTRPTSGGTYTILPGSLAHGYHRDLTNGRQTIVSQAIIEPSVQEDIRIRARLSTGTGALQVVADSIVIIKRLS